MLIFLIAIHIIGATLVAVIGLQYILNVCMLIAIIEQPRLTIGPANAIGVKEHESVHFKCLFNASLIPHLALCGWLKDGHNATNGNKWNTTESGFENHLICGFDIDNVSMADEGTYSCYCYYSESFREQFHFDEITSRFGEAVLQFEISKIIVLASSYTSNFIYMMLYFTEGKHHLFFVLLASLVILAIFISFMILRLIKYIKKNNLITCPKKNKGDFICIRI